MRVVYSKPAFVYLMAIAVFSFSACSKGGKDPLDDFKEQLANSLKDKLLDSIKYPTANGTWPMILAANYTYDSDELEFSAGVCQLKADDQTDDGSSASGFGGGTHAGTGWDSGNSWLEITDDNDCDGTNGDGSGTNCSELDSTWAPQWASIAGYWKLNESSWTPDTADEVQDSSGSDNHGTPKGDATTTTTSKMGKYAGTFDGTGDYVDFGNVHSFERTDTFSISAWFKTSNDSIVIVGKKPGADPHRGYELSIQPGGGIGAHLINDYTGGDYISTVTDLAFDDGNWHHTIMTYDGSSARAGLKVYADGVLQDSSGTDSLTATIVNAGVNFQIGADDGNSGMNGEIDEVAVWSVELTSAQVNHIYERQAAKFAGSFTSRILDTGTWGAGTATWTDLSWTPTLPFFKELPGGGGAANSETTSSYSSLVGSTGAADDDDLMANIEGLWHFNETAWDGTADEVVDDSGNGNHLYRAGGSVTTVGSGKFDRAGEFTTDTDYLYKDIDDWTSNFTVALWVKTSDLAQEEYSGIFASSDASGNDTFQIDMGGGAAGCSGKIRWVGKNSGANRIACFGSVTKQWTHLAVNFDGTTVRTYENGQFVDSNASGFTGTFNVLKIGLNRGGTKSWDGLIDEVAVWKRQLHATEISQLYLRGANRIKYQVRSCDDAACSGESWLGSDGTNQTYFSEINNNSVAEAMSGNVQTGLPSMAFSDFSSLTVSNNQYFQYRAILESDDATLATSPQLKSVVVGPTHYDASKPTVVNSTGINFTEVSEFGATLGSGNVGTVTFQISNNGINYYYWDSGSWIEATSTSLANDAATVNTHISTFDDDVGQGTYYWKAIFNSDGTEAVELDAVDSAAKGKIPGS